MATSSPKHSKRRRTTAKKAIGVLSKARSVAAPAVAGQAWEGVEQGLEPIDETARHAHEASQNAPKTVVAYTKKKPKKALAFASASGALLAAALNLFRPSRDKQSDANNR